MPEPPAPCPTCGRLDLANDEAARTALLADIRRDSDGRFDRAETWLRLSTTDDRLAVVRWIDRVLSRPPFSDRSADPVASLLAFIAHDLSYLTFDPLSPTTEDGVIPLPHPALDEPLGDEDDRPTSTTLSELKAGLGWA